MSGRVGLTMTGPVGLADVFGPFSSIPLSTSLYRRRGEIGLSGFWGFAGVLWVLMGPWCARVPISVLVGLF